MSRQKFDSSNESEYDDDAVVLLSPSPKQTTSKFTRQTTRKITRQTTTTSAITTTNTATNSESNTAYDNFCDAIADTVSQRIQKKKLDPNDKTDYEQLKNENKKLKERLNTFQQQFDNQNTVINNLQQQITDLQNAFNTHTLTSEIQNQAFLETMNTMTQYVQSMRIMHMCKQYKRRAFNEEQAEQQANIFIFDILF